MRRSAIANMLALAACMACYSAACIAEPIAKVVETKAASTTVTEGYFQELALDSPSSGPAIVSVDDENRVWVALARAGKLVSISNGVVRTFLLGNDSRPVGIIAGTRANGYPGSIWVAASYDNKIIRYDWQAGTKREYAIPGKDSWPFNISLDGKGYVWFTQRAAGRIGRLDPRSGEIAHVALPSENTGPAGLGVDQRTGRVWFTQSYADSVASYDPGTREIVQYKMGTASTGMISGPAGLAVGPDGAVWFAKLEGKLGYIAPNARHVELIAMPPEARRPAGVTLDAAGNVWVAALDGNALVRYRPSARDFTVYPLPVGATDMAPSAPPLARTSRPFGLAFDHGGNLWFSQQYTGQVGVLDVGNPTVQIMSPSSVTAAVDPYLTTRATDQVSGIAEVHVELDGKRITLDAGRLDLRHVAPGPHVLKVSAVDRAGNSAVATQSFSYAPDEKALPAVLGALRLKNPGEKALVDTLVMTSKDERNPQRLADIRDLLGKHRDSIQESDYDAAARTLDWVLQHSGSEQVVEVLDTAPYFSPRKVKLAPGGTVTWRYQGNKQGHEISHELHQIVVNGANIQSPLLRAGDKFSHRFNEAGTYRIVNAKRPGGELTVTVEQ